MEEKMKIRNIHIILIIVGTIFFLMGAFHSNIWFDEAYSVCLVRQSLTELIKIASSDVHPVLYYIALKIVAVIFGESIIAFRVFSVLGMVALSILGFTHIRKEFGEKVGILFSFLVIFLPVNLLYSNEIRMYSWAAFSVAVASIYAFKITKYNLKKDWIIFIVFSLISAYLHYFALFTVGVLNIVLLVYILKNNKILLKKWWIAGILQAVLYLPRINSIFETKHKSSCRILDNSKVSRCINRNCKIPFSRTIYKQHIFNICIDCICIHNLFSSKK